MRSIPSSDFEEESVVSLQERARAASRSTWVSVLVNLTLSAVQILIGYFARSQALIADGLHSLSDLLSDAVVLLANRASHKPPDAEHHYGHQRYETAASFAIGVLLLGVGAGMLWATVQKIQNPAAIEVVHPVALYVALGALICKELLFRYLLAVAKRVKSSLLVANAWHARSDAASSLVVAVGIVGNLAGYPILDPIAALVVGLMVLRMGWNFAWHAMNDLMDRAIDQEEAEAIRATIAATPGVRAVHDLRTRKMGDMILADAHIEVDADLTVEAGHDIAVEARRRVMQRHRVLNLMTHVDPWRRPDRDHEVDAP
jgi:cation diffusion facilitator family transporter